MPSLCIFSKDRPMQLDLCLRSLNNAPYFDDVKVLYLPQGKYAEGYDICKEEFPNVTFLKEESDFQAQIIDIVSNSQEYLAWGTDDSIFCTQVELTPAKLDWVFKTMGAISIILRVGENMKWQDHFQPNPSPPLPIVGRYEDMIAWDVHKCNEFYDVGRPWQNDCSIMPRDLYLERLHTETYWREHKSKSLDYLGKSGRDFDPCITSAFKDIVYLNIPINLVHLSEDGVNLADFGNWGKTVRYDTDMLHQLYMMGKRIDWNSLNLDDVNCPRREMAFRFYRP